MIKFGYTILYVQDVEETLQFYINAFGFKQKMFSPDKDYGELDTGNTTLSFASYALADYNKLSIQKTDLNSAAPACELAFVSDDVKSTFKQAIDAGATLVQDLSVKPWGQTVGYVRDLNGFLIEICTAVN